MNYDEGKCMASPLIDGDIVYGTMMKLPEITGIPEGRTLIEVRLHQSRAPIAFLRSGDWLECWDMEWTPEKKLKPGLPIWQKFRPNVQSQEDVPVGYTLGEHL